MATAPKTFAEKAAEQAALADRAEADRLAVEKIRPAPGMVLIRKERREKIRGVVVTEKSGEGWRLFVVRCGPGVEFYQPGDEVLVGSGTQVGVDPAGSLRLGGVGHYDVPGFPDLALLHASQLICVI